MESVKYMGIFKHDRVVEEHGQKFWLSSNEKGEDYYSLRNNKKHKYVMFVDPDSNIIGGVCPDGMLGFPIPYKVYFIDKVPDDIMKTIYTFTPETGFKRYFNVEAWKYNQMLEIDKLMLEAFHTGKPDPSLIERRKFVQEYNGDGSDL